MEKRKESIYTGVYPYRKYRWASCLCLKGKMLYLGVYDTELEAHLKFIQVYNKLSDEEKRKVLNKKKEIMYEINQIK